VWLSATSTDPNSLTFGQLDLWSTLLNPSNTELNPICHMVVLLGAPHIFHVSRIRVKDALIYQDPVVQKWLCSNVGMIVRGPNWSTWRKTCHSATFYNTNSTCCDLTLNPGLWVRWQRLTAWTMAQPSNLETWHVTFKPHTIHKRRQTYKHRYFKKFLHFFVRRVLVSVRLLRVGSTVHHILIVWPWLWLVPILSVWVAVER